MTPLSDAHVLAVPGQVVGVVNAEEHRSATILFTEPYVVELGEEEAEAFHLGDRVIVRGQVDLDKEGIWSRR